MEESARIIAKAFGHCMTDRYAVSTCVQPGSLTHSSRKNISSRSIKKVGCLLRSRTGFKILLSGKFSVFDLHMPPRSWPRVVG